MILRLLLVALLALAGAVALGHFVAVDPGFIVVGIGGKVLRSTFAFFLLAVLVFALLAYIAVRLLAHTLRLRRYFGRWSGDYRRRRAYRSLADGMLARAAGDYLRAERLFSQGADDQAQPEVHYLAAAEAAQAARADARRDNYLRIAQDLNPDARAALDLQRAGWLLEAGRLDEAAALIEALGERQATTPPLVRLKQRLYEQRGDWRALLELVPLLRRDRVLTHDEANALERDCAAKVLRDAHTPAEALDGLWTSLSKPLRAAPMVVAAYVQGLCRAGREDEAEKLLARQLDREWESDLAALYGEIELTPATRQLRKVESWAGRHDADPGLRLARARLAMRERLWGPARVQLEALVVEHPRPLFYRMLADVAEGSGDMDAAQRYRKQGLELATA